MVTLQISTPSMYLSICIFEIVMRKRTKINKKEAWIGPLFKKLQIKIQGKREGRR